MSAGSVGDRLPGWSRPLAVVAHPDDESFGLGAVLAAFAELGARVGVYCLTHGEASSLHEVPGELRRVREAELAAAASILGLEQAHLSDYPDGTLAQLGDMLVDAVDAAVLAADADGIVVFDRSGVTGHPDHVAATAAALAVAERRRLPMLEWTLPAPIAKQLNTELGTSFSGTAPGDIDLVLAVNRARQCRAIAAHASQAAPSSPLWRRLQLLSGYEYLRLSAWVA